MPVKISEAKSTYIDNDYSIYLYDELTLGYNKEIVPGIGAEFYVIKSEEELKTKPDVFGVFVDDKQIGLIAMKTNHQVEFFNLYVFIVKVFDKKNKIDYQLAPYAVYLGQKFPKLEENLCMFTGETMQIRVLPVCEYHLVDIDEHFPAHTRKFQLPTQADEKRNKKYWQLEELSSGIVNG